MFRTQNKKKVRTYVSWHLFHINSRHNSTNNLTRQYLLSHYTSHASVHACVCVYVFVRARARACVYVCVYVMCMWYVCICAIICQDAYAKRCKRIALPLHHHCVLLIYTFYEWYFLFVPSFFEHYVRLIIVCSRLTFFVFFVFFFFNRIWLATVNVVALSRVIFFKWTAALRGTAIS